MEPPEHNGEDKDNCDDRHHWTTYSETTFNQLERSSNGWRCGATCGKHDDKYAWKATTATRR